MITDSENINSKMILFFITIKKKQMTNIFYKIGVKLDVFLSPCTSVFIEIWGIKKQV